MMVYSVRLTWTFLRKLNVNTHQSHPQAKKCLGPNIAQRPQVADQRSEIGHWELDTIQGHKDGKNSVLLVMTDRFSRVNITRKITSKTAYAVNHFFVELRQKLGKSAYYRIFKTITSDNEVLNLVS